MTKSLRTLGIMAALIAVVMILGAATMHPMGDSKQWAITASWAKSKRRGEWVSYNPAPETLVGAAACTTGWFTSAGNRIYIDGKTRGDTIAGEKDSTAGTVYLYSAMDTSFTQIVMYDSFTWADSSTDASGTVQKDSLDCVLGCFLRFITKNRSADTGVFKLYANSPDGYFID